MPAAISAVTFADCDRLGDDDAAIRREAGDGDSVAVHVGHGDLVAAVAVEVADCELAGRRAGCRGLIGNCPKASAVGNGLQGKGDPGSSRKAPRPSPASRVTLAPRRFAVTMSGLPSRFTSQARTR